MALKKSTSNKTPQKGLTITTTSTKGSGKKSAPKSRQKNADATKGTTMTKNVITSPTEERKVTKVKVVVAQKVPKAIFSIYIPKDIKEAAKEIATKNGQSLNEFLSSIIGENSTIKAQLPKARRQMARTAHSLLVAMPTV